ncbi:MAG: hypothetical protein WD716_13215 [Fimbriimonadaceae bacterium]
MTKQKKQMIVIGVLLLAVLGIGAFQFMGPKPKPVAADDADKPKEDQTLVAANTVDPVASAIGLLLDQPGSPRDPFVPQAVLIDPEPDREPTRVIVRPPDEISGGTGPVNPGGFGGPITGPIDTQIIPDSAPFTLRGVMIGKKNLAVIELAGGRQILVAEGEKFGTDSSVLAVSENEVVIKVNGKVQTLPLGGN